MQFSCVTKLVAGEGVNFVFFYDNVYIHEAESFLYILRKLQESVLVQLSCAKKMSHAKWQSWVISFARESQDRVRNLSKCGRHSNWLFLLFECTPISIRYELRVLFVLSVIAFCENLDLSGCSADGSSHIVQKQFELISCRWFQLRKTSSLELSLLTSVSNRSSRKLCATYFIARSCDVFMQ